ncbi:UDP-N-acetylmuramate--L-alanine ligase [Candidatus Peribacteria bacterium]|nr:UDP-N-acetylmuramate--L-alanine ligase [Candidatus Peribacteria bacterium]
MRIFCSGIGGIGLSAYGSHMRSLGDEVHGSDRTDSELLRDLRLQGIQITLKQDGENMPEDLDLFVYSEAIPEDSPERTEAARRRVRQISYFQALGELTAGKDLIAVCGTHGKSSTTAMAVQVLVDAKRDPSAIIGTKVPFLQGKNWRKGKGDLWIVEACEYRRSFLFLKPSIILVTNTDGDHFDSFTDIDDYRQAFLEFFSSLPKNGTIIAHGLDEESMKIARASGRTCIDADKEEAPELGVPGNHMKQNAKLVLALARHLGVDDHIARESLKNFTGTWRRMEVKGTKNGVTVIDDYAHHPKEIRATLAAMKEAYGNRRMIAVFQPHTHDRTRKLWDEFTTAFGDADEILLTSVYDARPDRESERVDEKALAEAIAKGSGKPCLFAGEMEKTEQILCSKIAKSGDVIVVMGAGDITELAARLLKH